MHFVSRDSGSLEGSSLVDFSQPMLPCFGYETSLREGSDVVTVDALTYQMNLQDFSQPSRSHVPLTSIRDTLSCSDKTSNFRVGLAMANRCTLFLENSRGSALVNFRQQPYN